MEFSKLGDAAKLDLAIDAYVAAQITLGQFAALLGVAQCEAERILKSRDVVLDYTLQDLDKDSRALDELLRR